MTDAPFPKHPTRSTALSDADVITAREQFRTIMELEGDLRRRLKSDHEYIDGVSEDRDGNPVGRMWTDAERRDRTGRPTLEIDALSGPISQVSNAMAEAKPAADMVPIGPGADDHKAEVWEGLLRRIQTTPEAEFAANYATDILSKIGRGCWGLTHKWPEFNGNPKDPANWEGEIRRFWIENQHAVFLGPATEPDGSDRMFGFILQPLTKDQFNAKFAKGDTDEFTANKSAFEALASDERAALSAWHTSNTVTVASWYRIKTKDVQITGQTMKGTQTRTVKERYVCLSTITATKEYEYDELPIPYIPIVLGEARRSNIDGKKDVRGIVRKGRQPQDMVNTWNSYIAETIARAARQEVIAAEGQIDETNQGFWDMTKRLMYRLYKPTTLDGTTLVPPPTIVSAEPPIQAMSLALQQAESNVLKATLHYDAASDETNAERSKESGRARLMRQRQGELGSSDFMRAYVFMIQYEIKILMAWIPKVYDAARVMRITGRDEEEMAAVTHFGDEFAQDAQQLAASIEGVKGIYDLSTGRYDTKANVERNPMVQRQENVDILTETVPLLQPPQQAAVLPIMFEEMGGTVMRRVSAALKPKEQTVSLEDAQKAQMVIDEQSRIITELQRKIDAKADQDESKERIALAEIESTERIEAAKLKLEREKMLHETKMKEYELLIAQHQAEFDAYQAGLDREHTSQEAEAARQHASSEKDADRGFKVYDAERNRAHDSAEAEVGRQFESAEAEEGRAHEGEMADVASAHAIEQIQAKPQPEVRP